MVALFLQTASITKVMGAVSVVDFIADGAKSMLGRRLNTSKNTDANNNEQERQANRRHTGKHCQ